MKKFLVALLLMCLFKTAANAQSQLQITNYTHCDAWVTTMYLDPNGVTYPSNVIYVAAGSSLTYYYYSVPAPDDFGFFFTTTVYESDPTTCPTANYCILGDCTGYSPTGSVIPSSCSTCTKKSLNCSMYNPCPPFSGPQTSTLSIN